MWAPGSIPAPNSEQGLKKPRKKRVWDGETHIHTQSKGVGDTVYARELYMTSRRHIHEKLPWLQGEIERNIKE